MANAVYDLWKDLVLEAGTGEAALDLTSATLKVAAIDTGTYTFSQAHQFYDDGPEAGTVGTPVTLGSITHLAGTLDTADATFTDLDGTSIEALVLFMDTGTPGTSPLLCYIDTNVTGLPLTTDGEATVTWDASGIFDL